MTQTPNSDTVTEGIRVQAAAQYMPQESDPDRSQYVYVYRIRIANEGARRARLLSRHWVIVDGHNNREEVIGEGVVGKQPDLGPGEFFEYKSYCPLPTEWGTMEGTYQFRTEDGHEFEVRIGRFFLAPTVENSLVADG